jgi:MYXO-CTERM domain-containing protein
VKLESSTGHGGRVYTGVVRPDKSETSLDSIGDFGEGSAPMREPWAAALFLALLPRPALADGAFPDSVRIFAPAEIPNQIILATNFGLIINEGQAQGPWSWICEAALIPDTSNIFLYQMGPAPTHTIFAVDMAGALISTPNLGCGSHVATFSSTGTHSVYDVFPDPTDATHVFAIAAVNGTFALYPSSDGGRSFQEPIFTAPGEAFLLSVESAKSDPKVVYMTMTSRSPVVPYVIASIDGLRTSTTYDLSSVLGKSGPKIMAVSHRDPKMIFFRVQADDGTDQLAVSEDGGKTVRIAAETHSTITDFLERQSGTMLMPVLAGGGYQSMDGGHTWVPWNTPAHLRAVAERAGGLLGSGDNFADKFAVATSIDGGTSWQPAFRFVQISGPAACPSVAAACCTGGLGWPYLMGLFGIGVTTTTAACPAGPPDAGTGPTMPPAKSCGCRSSTGEPEGAVLGLLALGFLFARLRSKRGSA